MPDLTCDDVLAKSLAALDRQLDLVNEKTSAEGKHNERTSSQAQRIVRSVAALVAQVRQREKDWHKRAEALTYSEKVAVMVDFFRVLPREHQDALLAELAEIRGAR